MEFFVYTDAAIRCLLPEGPTNQFLILDHVLAQAVHDLKLRLKRDPLNKKFDYSIGEGFIEVRISYN